MFTVHSKANDTEYKVWGVDAKLLICDIIIIIIIKICKIDKIWKEYFYHIPNQVNVPGLVTAAILAIILLQKWITAFQSESSNTRFLLSYHVPLHSCKCS